MPSKKKGKKCSDQLEPNSSFNNRFDGFGSSFMFKLPDDKETFGTFFGSVITIFMGIILVLYGLM